MQFDLNHFLTRSTTPETREFLLKYTEQDFLGYTVISPCNCTFYAEHKGEKAALKIHIATEIQAECARCLELVVKRFEFQQEYLVSLNQLQSEMCELPIKGRGLLDLDELARSEIILQAPQVLICDELCKGLCPVCGKPRKLNCSCDVQQADERLSVFEQLLS